MPRGLYRIHQTRLPHFITFTCYRRHHCLSNPASRDEFLKSLERTRVRYNFFIYGFVVMPNHVHLLISEPQEGTIANVVQSLKIGSAKQIKRLKQGQKPHNCQPKAIVGHESGHDSSSPFWQARYYDRNVHDNEEFINDLKYIHRNPVKRGLVEKPEAWPWSSYRSYALHERGLVTVETPWAAYKRKYPLADPNQLSASSR